MRWLASQAPVPKALPPGTAGLAATLAIVAVLAIVGVVVVLVVHSMRAGRGTVHRRRRRLKDAWAEAGARVPLADNAPREPGDDMDRVGPPPGAR